MTTAITVHPNMLDSWSHANLDWKTALGELIDNGFDANATRIHIESLPGNILIYTDDGDGCDDLVRMLTIGLSYEQTRVRRLGRYGVGFKEAALWLASKVEITSAANGVLRNWSVDWETVKASGNWDTGSDPTQEDATDKACREAGLINGHGMRLVFTRVKKILPSGKNMLPIVADLGFTFHPAVSSGRQIVVTARKKNHVISPYQLPPLAAIVEGEASVNGKTIRVHAGIVPPEHKNKRPGFAYLFHHRVIDVTSLGAKGYSTARVCGSVHLGDKWGLSKNKTSLADNDADALEAAVFNIVEPMLKEAQTQTQNLASTTLSKRVANLLNQATRKAKRKPRENQTGKIEPKGTDRKVRKARRSKPGASIIGPRNLGGLGIDFTDDSSKGIGWVDLPGNKIWLWSDHPFVAYVLKTDNHEALIALVASLYVEHLGQSEDSTKQKLLPAMAGVDEEFTRGMTSLLEGVPLDGNGAKGA